MTKSRNSGKLRAILKRLGCKNTYSLRPTLFNIPNTLQRLSICYFEKKPSFNPLSAKKSQESDLV